MRTPYDRTLIECVPNFSEGRDPGVVAEIARAIAQVAGVALLGYESDHDHHRSVVTFAGEAEAVLEGAIRGVGKAAELVDLREHAGVHPRVGAADVVPFIPLAGAKLADGVACAHRAGAEIWRRFGIPVYFYEAAALQPGRKRLEKVRRIGFDGMPPDIGGVAEHPAAGAAVVGARNFLIAYNINLATPDAAVAKAIAVKIRESTGGFPFVKAMGLYLKTPDCAQVSMNLTNFAEIPLDALYDTVRREAQRLGTSIAESELIGFIPQAAYEKAPAFFRRARGFDDSRIIENRIAQLLRSR
ncbi:MAG: glutamate formimidoyltransferase [Bryobacterales bacterium]|nr:glutamate formimidoyltransferase [Bryobacterales bacterium]